MSRWSAPLLQALGLSTIPEGAIEPLQADEVRFDLGTIGQGESRDHLFALTNRGTCNISIASVQPTCTCTVAEFPFERIEPGRTVPLRLALNAGAARGDKHVDCNVLYLVGRSLRRLTLTLVATVEPDIVASAESLSFSPSARSRDIVLSPGRLSSFKVLDVKCSHPSFRADARRENDDRTIVHVSFQDDKRSGSFRQSALLVTTDSANEPLLRIPLSWDAVPAR